MLALLAEEHLSCSFPLATGWKPHKALNTYTNYDKNQVTVRPTAKPREALVDAPSITAPPGTFSEPNSPVILENSSRSRRTFFTT